MPRVLLCMAGLRIKAKVLSDGLVGLCNSGPCLPCAMLGSGLV